MSLRERYPRAQMPTSHYFVSLARGESMRTFSLRPWTLWAAGGVFGALLAWSAGATAYIAFKDDMLGAFLARQSEMQAAYEDRLAEARAALDKVAGRQLLDQGSFEGKLHDLLSRQALLEQRGAVVAEIAKEAGAHGAGALPEIHAKAPTKGGSAQSAFAGLSGIGGAPPGGARAYAPMDSTLEITPNPNTNGKPRPLDGPQQHSLLELPPGADKDAADLLASVNDPAMQPSGRLSLIAVSLDRTERKQLAALQTVGAQARRFTEKWRALIAKTGMPIDLTPTGAIEKGVGGPFIALAPGDDPSGFNKSAAAAAKDVAQMVRMKKVLPYLPIREPLFGEMRETSPFGYRSDPFLGRAALHPGIDLVQAYGAEIHATAAGKVTHAGPMGGYGNAVEIDHGGGIATRYGHMSEVLVSEGDEIKIGQVIGLIGSTGRSTGPHLHYEVRIDGEPVDPAAYLEVAASLAPL